ncbi:6604_t:CDS:2 [Acaulospora morrowiae]|uniref:6604_t:CDS:1 n=1 Tax=Acaulospora morrowiae TaxID=94023 RepID=A0A9N8Z975_9GLOM|nr:6604_t:CDS:2 [Acaulospora morrowiae]
MESYVCEHEITEIVDSAIICKKCGEYISSEIFEPDSHDLYEGRTLRPVTLDGTRIDPGGFQNKLSAKLAINQITYSLGLETIESKVTALFNMVEKKFQVGEGHLLRVVIGACALLIIREEKIPKTMREVAFTLDLEIQQLTNVVHKIRMHLMPSVPSFIDVEVLVNKVMHELFENRDNRQYLPIYVDTQQLDHLRQDVQAFDTRSDSNYPEDSVSRKEFQDHIMKYYRKVFTGLCMQLLKYANEGNIITGKQPSPVGAAIILIAVEATEKPSHEEWKNNHKRASDIISRMFQVDSHLIMIDRYKELIDLIHSKVINLPWSFLAQENKSRSYLYLVDLVQFHAWISDCREKGKQKRRAMMDRDTGAEHDETISTDHVDHGGEGRSPEKSYSKDRVTSEEHRLDVSDVPLDDEELEEYMRTENEIEMARNSWEDQESSGDQSEHNNTKSKMLKKRRQVLREKGTFKKRRVDDRLEASQSDGFGDTDGDDVASNAHKKVARTEKTSKIKLNFDPSTIDMNLFDHI